MTMLMPRTLPVLEPDDFIMGPLADNHGRYCLLGWKEKVFGELIWGDETAGTHTETLKQCCRDAGRPRILSERTANTLRNRQAAAAIWADFLEEIGYVEDGPETTIE